MQKRLYKSKRNRTLLGVCGGIGEYLDVDPTIIRILWVIFTFMGGAGILAYIVCALIMSNEPNDMV